MGKRKRDRKFNSSAKLNNLTYSYYYNRLKELAMSMFEWKNLPDSIDPRFLELTLFEKGVAVYFRDEDLTDDEHKNGRDLVLPVTLKGGFDVYGIPKERRAYAVNSYNFDLNENDSVLIFNNYLHQNCVTEIEMYALRLANLDRAIDVNANAQKTPVLIKCDEQQRLTMENLYMQYDGNMPFIFADKNLNANGLSVLKTDAPFVADRLYSLKTQIWNEALTYLGISNLNIQKKERLVADEVTRNLGSTIASRHGRLQSRRDAANMINKMFGTNIEVNYREDYREVDDETMYPGETGEGGSVDMVIDERTR